MLRLQDIQESRKKMTAVGMLPTLLVWVGQRLPDHFSTEPHHDDWLAMQLRGLGIVGEAPPGKSMGARRTTCPRKSLLRLVAGVIVASGRAASATSGFSMEQSAPWNRSTRRP